MGPVEGQLLGDFFGLEIGRKWNVTTCELRLDGSYYGGCEEFTIELMSSQNLGDVLAFEFIVDQFGEYQTTLKALKRDNAYFFVDPEDNEQFVLQLPVQPGDLVMPLTVPLHGFEPLYLVGEDEVELDGIVKPLCLPKKSGLLMSMVMKRKQNYGLYLIQESGRQLSSFMHQKRTSVGKWFWNAFY